MNNITQFREPTEKELWIYLGLSITTIVLLVITLATRLGSFDITHWQNVTLLCGIVLFGAAIVAVLMLRKAFYGAEARNKRGRGNAHRREIEHWETQIIIDKAFFILTAAAFAIAFVHVVLYCSSFFTDMDIAGVIILPTVFPTLTVVSVLVFAYLIWRDKKMKAALQECLDAPKPSAHKKSGKAKQAPHTKKHPHADKQQKEDGTDAAAADGADEKATGETAAAGGDNEGELDAAAADDDADDVDEEAPEVEASVEKPDPFELIRKK